jgi:subtilisin family serine protease
MRKYRYYILLIIILISVLPAWRKIKRDDFHNDRFFNNPVVSFDCKSYVGKTRYEYSKDKIIVKLNSNMDSYNKNKIFAQTGFKRYKKLFDNYYLYENDKKIDNIKDIIEEIKDLPGVDKVEPDYIAYIQTTPHDPYLKYQYYLANFGQTLTVGGQKITVKKDCDIKAKGAWDYSTGKDDFIIAVVDSGVDYSHPDLRDKLMDGYNFVVGNPYAIDDNGHGTEMAGIIGATTDNRLGISGICWNCKILPVKVLGANGKGTYSAIALGIRYAVDHGAKIINLSLGGEPPSFILEDAVKYAFNKGVAVFAATGNENKNTVLYPAAYTSYVMAVAASNYNDQRTPYSNHAPEVMVAAPGTYILTTTLQGKYAYVTGTSPATAIVSGIAGLILSLKDTLSPSDLYKVIMYAADDVNKKTEPGVDIYFGYGRADAKKSVSPIELK